MHQSYILTLKSSLTPKLQDYLKCILILLFLCTTSDKKISLYNFVMAYMDILLRDMLYPREILVMICLRFTCNMEKKPATDTYTHCDHANETAAFFICNFCTIFRISNDAPGMLGTLMFASEVL